MFGRNVFRLMVKQTNKQLCRHVSMSSFDYSTRAMMTKTWEGFPPVLVAFLYLLNVIFHSKASHETESHDSCISSNAQHQAL